MWSGDRAHNRPDIDGLRAITVVAAILFHAGVRQELDGSSFTLIDMTAHFCTGARCAIGSAETPLYRDAHHLSLAGSRFAMSALEPTMDAMRARSASNADRR